MVAGAAEANRSDIPKGGYVPVCSWRHSQEPAGKNVDPPEAAPQAAPDTPSPFEGAWGLLKSPGLLVTAAIGALLLAGAVIVWTMPVSDEPAPLADTRPALPQPSLAGLPFSLSGDEQHVAHRPASMSAEVVRELVVYSRVVVIGQPPVR